MVVVGRKHDDLMCGGKREEREKLEGPSFIAKIFFIGRDLK